jgi:hypothetical protein
MPNTATAPPPDQTPDKTIARRDTIVSQVKAPISQERNPYRRANWPEWMRQMPRIHFPPPNESFQLIDPQKLTALLSTLDNATQQSVTNDLSFLNSELIKRFQERDHEASLQQNRYRLYQIGFIVLATIATILGSLQSLALGNNPTLVPWLAFVETMVALAATYLATISAREPPFERWMANRQRAEGLRREYFRFLLCLPPYDTITEEYKRRLMLKERMSDIYRGVFPQESLPTL